MSYKCHIIVRYLLDTCLTFIYSVATIGIYFCHQTNFNLNGEYEKEV